MPRLTAEQRERAIGTIQMGASRGHVARTFGCSTTAISNLIQRFQQTGQTRDRPRSGRPRITTAQENQYIRNLHLRNRCLAATSKATTALGRHLSRHLRSQQTSPSYGIRNYRPYRGTFLTLRHRQQRLLWARQETEPFGGGGVMIWGLIYGDWTTRFVVFDETLTGQRYINYVLRPVVLPFSPAARDSLPT
ncbi:uncharacterized protein LOC124285066 [Haliotis rubra]|uniref:uncharacterized protein LOC124285066 n=1 Tax=Haliotis rubra TaxID=36100 RepID=UPI001EE57E48|nr:uncharacterized protein LOC124285066 [Haliotis rubra]